MDKKEAIKQLHDLFNRCVASGLKKDAEVIEYTISALSHPELSEVEVESIIKQFIDVQNGVVTLPHAEMNFTTKDIVHAICSHLSLPSKSVGSKLLKACNSFKTFYMTLIAMNPESAIQLKEIIPPYIINNIEDGIKEAEALPSKESDRIKELEGILECWHKVFGTTQLTHAQCRLEVAEDKARKFDVLPQTEPTNEFPVCNIDGCKIMPKDSSGYCHIHKPKTEPKECPDREVDIDFVSGVEGPHIGINSYRVCGPKAWGGGKILFTWKVPIKDILHAIGMVGIGKSPSLEAKIRLPEKRGVKVCKGKSKRERDLQQEGIDYGFACGYNQALDDVMALNRKEDM